MTHPQGFSQPSRLLWIRRSHAAGSVHLLVAAVNCVLTIAGLALIVTLIASQQPLALASLGPVGLLGLAWLLFGAIWVSLLGNARRASDSPRRALSETFGTLRSQVKAVVIVLMVACLVVFAVQLPTTALGQAAPTPECPTAVSSNGTLTCLSAEAFHHVVQAQALMTLALPTAVLILITAMAASGAIEAGRGGRVLAALGTPVQIAPNPPDNDLAERRGTVLPIQFEPWGRFCWFAVSHRDRSAGPDRLRRSLRATCALQHPH